MLAELINIVLATALLCQTFEDEAIFELQELQWTNVYGRVGCFFLSLFILFVQIIKRL